LATATRRKLPGFDTGQGVIHQAEFWEISCILELARAQCIPRDEPSRGFRPDGRGSFPRCDASGSPQGQLSSQAGDSCFIWSSLRRGFTRAAIAIQSKSMPEFHVSEQPRWPRLSLGFVSVSSQLVDRVLASLAHDQNGNGHSISCRIWASVSRTPYEIPTYDWVAGVAAFLARCSRKRRGVVG
jgi:hypothetical protein